MAAKPVKVATLEEFISNKNFAHEHPEEEPKDNGDKQESLYSNFKTQENFYQKYAWACSIDLNSCVGCQGLCGCVPGGEQHSPVVGKEQVQRGRKMQWIRIDSYYEGDPANPSVYFQPVPCHAV